MRRKTFVSIAAGMLVLPSLIYTTTSAAHVTSPGHSRNSVTCKKRIRPSGVVKFSDWEFPSTLNTDQTSLYSSFEIMHGVLESLFEYNNHARLVPLLATAIPTVKNGGITNNGKTYTIHLKPGLKWSNGQALTSKDVKFGWEVDMDKASGPYCTGTCDVISTISTPNATTAVFHLKQPSAPFLADDLPEILPVSWPNDWNNDPTAAANKVYQDSSFNYEDASYPTNGAYQVTQYVNNDRVVLSPMKYYTATSCGAYLQNSIFEFYSSKAGMIAAAAAHQTDVTFDYTPADLPALTTNTSYTVHVDPSFTFEHLEFNTDSTYKGQPNPVANPNVREALALALDKYGLIRSGLGLDLKTAKQIVAWSPLVNTPTLVQPFADKQINGQWDPITRKFVIPGTARTLADAKKLLAATQFAKGFSLDFYTTEGNPVRQAEEAVMAASWAKLGVQVNPNYIPASALVGSWTENGVLDHGNFQVTLFATTGGSDPDYLRTDMQSRFCDRDQQVHSGINGNYACIRDVVVNRAFNQGARLLTKAARSRAYASLQVEVNKMAYWIPLYFRPAISTDDGHVLNFSNNPTAEPEWNMYAWRATSS